MWKVNYALLHCKRACFALQKGIFYTAKGRLLHCKRASFTLQKGVFYIAKGHLLRACLQPIDFLLVTKLILKHFR